MVHISAAIRQSNIAIHRWSVLIGAREPLFITQASERDGWASLVYFFHVHGEALHPYFFGRGGNL